MGSFISFIKKEMLARIAREAAEDWTAKSWFPPKGQIGTAWIPNADSTDEKLSLDKVEVLMYLFAIQLGLAIIGILSDWMDCNKKDEEAAPAPAAGRKISAKKEKAGKTSTNSTGFFLGLFGVLAILYNCKQMLLFTVVCNFIVVIGCAIMLVLMIIGFCAMGAAAEGEGLGMGCACCMIICSSFSMAISCAFQIAMLDLSMPFIQQDGPAGTQPL